VTGPPPKRVCSSTHFGIFAAWQIVNHPQERSFVPPPPGAI
jgi:hypothetical protein